MGKRYKGNPEDSSGTEASRTFEEAVVIDPCCGSGSTLRAACELGRSSYGFEIDRTFYQKAKDEMLIDYIK